MRFSLPEVLHRCRRGWFVSLVTQRNEHGTTAKRKKRGFMQDAMNETLIGERSMKREKSGRKSGFTTHKRVFYLSLPIMTSISASAGADSPAGRLPTSPPRALAIESAPDPFDPERSTTIVLG